MLEQPLPPQMQSPQEPQLCDPCDACSFDDTIPLPQVSHLALHLLAQCRAVIASPTLTMGDPCWGASSSLLLSYQEMSSHSIIVTLVCIEHGTYQGRPLWDQTAILHMPQPSIQGAPRRLLATAHTMRSGSATKLLADRMPHYQKISSCLTP